MVNKRRHHPTTASTTKSTKKVKKRPSIAPIAKKRSMVIEVVNKQALTATEAAATEAAVIAKTPKRTVAPPPFTTKSALTATKGKSVDADKSIDDRPVKAKSVKAKKGKVQKAIAPVNTPIDAPITQTPVTKPYKLHSATHAMYQVDSTFYKDISCIRNFLTAPAQILARLQETLNATPDDDPLTLLVVAALGQASSRVHAAVELLNGAIHDLDSYQTEH